MINRRRFLKASALGSSALVSVKELLSMPRFAGAVNKPIVISTWAPNVKANAEAWKILSAGGRALDAVESGVKIPEADPRDQSVGYGGLPDRDGKVTLDACIMDELGNCGAVMGLEHIMHAIAVARLVMEKTPHVQLVGAGALQFALERGFKKQNLLTPEAEKAWRNWLKTSNYDPMITVRNVEERIEKEEKEKGKNKVKDEDEKMPWPASDLNHDTIGMVALDAKGNLSGACTTSGMAYKMHGRVGDSPIIGAGMFVDNEVGAATATGVGEEVVRICGAHTIIEMMRQGYSPEEACKKAIERVVKRHGEKGKSLQVGFIALNRNGEHGAFAIAKGVSYAVRSNEGEQVFQVKSWFA